MPIFCIMFQEVFHQRVKVFQSWEAGQQTLNKKREVEAKMQLSGKTDKLDQAKADIAEVSKITASNVV